jgi:UDP-GlcNAc:undecaprenyl-phosphate GlcNAc-1-phosphate transferase
MLQLGYEAPMAVIAIYGISLLWSLLALVLRKSPDFLLFGLFWVFNFLFYVGLKLFLSHSGKKSRQNPPVRAEMDSSTLSLDGGSIQTVIFCILQGLITFYLLFALVFLGRAEMWGFCLFPLIVLGVIGIPGFRSRTPDLAYFGLFGTMALVVVFQMEQAGSRFVAQWMTVNSITNGLFVLISIVSGLYFLLWREGQKVFGSPLGFLVLAMSLSLSVVSPDFDLSYNFSGVVSKSIVLLLAFKILKIHSVLQQAKS